MINKKGTMTSFRKKDIIYRKFIRVKGDEVKKKQSYIIV